MRAVGIAEDDQHADHPFGAEAVRHLIQADSLVYEETPEALDKEFVRATAPAAHGNCDSRVPRRLGEVKVGYWLSTKFR
jgi:hypothetical protein